MTVLPYQKSEGDKKSQVARMFNNISGRYDFLNHFLSFGIDIIWRKKAIKLLKNRNPGFILDVATGTADFAIEALKLNPDKIIGVDISEGMLQVGRDKINKLGLDKKIELFQGDSENLQFPEYYFDAVTVAFGVRNFANLEIGLQNMHRVLKPGGCLVVLEFSKPKAFPIKQLYYLYSRFILPVFGRLISKDKTAYTYLPKSVQAFPEGNSFLEILDIVGFKNTKCIPLTFGVSSIYFGEK